MPPFNLVPAPVFSPTRCTTCGANRCGGGFVDLIIDDVPIGGFDEDGNPRVSGELGVGFGHLYLCADCSVTVASLIGWRSPEDWTRAENDVGELSAKVDELERELEAEREQKVVPVGDVVALIEERESARRSRKSPVKPAA